MSLKIRLQRVGTTKKPFYRVVAVDSRKKRDSDVIDYIGIYQPIVKEKQFEVDETKILKWLQMGARPTDTIMQLLKKEGIWKKHISAK